MVLAAYRALAGRHLTAEYAAELSAVSRRADEAEVLVAVEDDVIGCVTLVPDDSSPWAELLEPGESGIRMLAVDPARQNRGVGAALLDRCIDEASAMGREALFLHSTPWMEAAHRLYGRAGFERVPERDYDPVPEVPLLAFRLALPLAGRGRPGSALPAGARPQP